MPTPNTSDAMKRYKAGKAGFTDKAHLKAKGLIPRADGTKRKSPKYEDLDKGDVNLIDTFLINIYETFVDFGEIILTDTNYKDQISRYFQNTFNIYPKYEIIKIDNNKYICNLFKDKERVSTGYGTTKKGAEQDSSKNALIKYGVLN